MAQEMRKAIDATRDNCGIVEFGDEGLTIRFNKSVPLAADDLVRESGWVVAYQTASEEGFYVYTSLD